MPDGETSGSDWEDLNTKERVLVREITSRFPPKKSNLDHVKTIITLLIGLGTVSAGVLWMVDCRYTTVTQLITAEKQHNGDQDAHLPIQRVVQEGMAKFMEGLHAEREMRALQGKDVEVNAKEISRLNRRLRDRR